MQKFEKRDFSIPGTPDVTVITLGISFFSYIFLLPTFSLHGPVHWEAKKSPNHASFSMFTYPLNGHQAFHLSFLKSIIYGVNVTFPIQYIMALIIQSFLPLKAPLSAMDSKSQ